MNHLNLLDRIKTLDIATVERMSPEVLAKLTDGFDESLVRNVLYTETTNHGQRRIFRALKRGYKNWKMATDQFWGNPPLFPERYPQYLEELQMDIECGYVVTPKGTLEEDHARLKISLIPSGAVPVKPNPQADQSTEQTNKVDTINKDTIDADDKDKLISELRDAISHIKSDFEQYKQEHSITQEQLEAIFSDNSSEHEKSEIIDDEISQPNLPEGQKRTEDNAILYVEIAELRKELGIKNLLLEEAQQRIKELEAQVEETKHQNETTAKYSLDWLEDWQQLSTRELAIFFAQALGVSFDPELVVQTQLANLAATWTKPQPDTIRAKIGKLFNEESDVNEKKT